MDETSPADATSTVPVALWNPPQPRWSTWMTGIIASVVLVLMVLTLTVLDGSPWSVLPLVLPAGMLVYYLFTNRRPRIELCDDGMVVRSLRTVRIPYEDITAVHGDVPSRLDWSTRLTVDRREGRPVGLPLVDAPLPEVHDLIVARAGLC